MGIALPAAYELLGTFMPVTLTPNTTHTFSVRFLANTVKGAFSGAFALHSNDADEGSFDLTLAAQATITYPAALDLGFDADGKVITAMGSTDDYGRSLAVQSDGKIVVAGYTYTGGNADFAVARYTVDGALDTSFGTAGKVITPVGSGNDFAFSVVVQSDGKIAVGGYSRSGTYDVFAVVRYTSAGALDSGFGSGGIALLPIGTGNASLYEMAQQSDGKLVAAGEAFVGGKFVFALARYTTDGMLDPSFGAGNVVTTLVGTHSFGRSLAIQDDGKIVVAGNALVGATRDFAIVRYGSDGALDTGFGSGGKVTTAIGGADDYAYGVAVQGDGRLVLGGTSHNGSNNDFAAVRYLSSGTLDTGFGTAGKVTTPIGHSHDEASSVAVQSDGKIILAGSTMVSAGSNYDVGLVRYTSAGTLDTAFGTTGKLTAAIGTSDDLGHDIALASGGRIVVAGSSYSSASGNNDFGLLRYGMDLAPTIATTATAPVGTITATLNGTVNPNGITTSAWFEYGTTTIYGQTTSSQLQGYGTSANPVSAALTGLTPGTLYHYRLVAQNGAVTSNTADGVFTTQSILAFTYNAAGNVPVTASSFTATGTFSATLNFAPAAGTTLMVVKNTGLGFITGAFSNLAQGQAVALSFGGLTYNFVVDYYGGSGNDLVLHWAGTRVMDWGSDMLGQLGNNSMTNSSVPVAVDATGVLAGKTVIAVTGGQPHSLALCADGTVAAWGGNGNGRLGNGSYAPSSVPVKVDATGVLAGKTVIDVAAGAFHSLALCSDGTVAAWGGNSNGELGNGSTIMDSNVPVAVSTAGALAGKTVVAVAAGEYHNLALCSDGTLAAWGGNFDGQLGNNSIAQSNVPVALGTLGVLAGKTVIAVAVGGHHNLALCDDGTVAAWGSNMFGLLGNNSTEPSNVPVAVDTTGVLAGKTVIAVAAGHLHSLVLCSDGTLAAWGENIGGQLGDNSTTNSRVPVAVDMTGVLAGKTVVAVAAGYLHSLALCSDGTVAAWGSNGYGALGNNSTMNSSVPVLVSTATLAAGDRFAAAAAGTNADHSLTLVAPAQVPVATVTGITPASGSTAGGTSVTITGTGFSGATAVTFGGSAATSMSVVDATTLIATTPAHAIGAVSVLVITPGGGTNTANTLYTYLAPLALWRQFYFGSPANNGNGADNYDFDNDGLPNLIEWACNLNPTTTSVLPITTTRNGAFFEFTYTRSVAALNAGAVFTVEWSDNLPGSSWSATGVTESLLSNNGTVQQVKALVPVGSQGRRFVHLSVTSPP